MNRLKKIALCTSVLLAMASSCFAIDSGYYYRLDGDKLFTVTVLAHDGYEKNLSQLVRHEFVELKNSFDESYSSILIPTGAKTYATTSGFVTNADDEKGRNVSGYYNVFGSFNINVGTASDVIIRLFENGNPVATTYGEATASENNDVVNVSFEDVIKVIPSNDDNVANLSVRISSAGNVVTGTLIVEYVR